MTGKTHTYKVKENNQDVIYYPQLNYNTYRHVRWEKEERKLKSEKFTQQKESVSTLHKCHQNKHLLPG